MICQTIVFSGKATNLPKVLLQTAVNLTGFRKYYPYAHFRESGLWWYGNPLNIKAYKEFYSIRVLLSIAMENKGIRKCL